VGVHLTVTSEWEFISWGPITGARSLVAEDGRFPRTIAEVGERADREQMYDEFVAQTELFLAAGLDIGYFDCHMGIVDPAVYAKVCRKYGKPFDYPIEDVAVGFDSVHMLSGRPSDEKIPYLVDRISNMEPGKHLIVSHCAVASEELFSMTSNTADNAPWAYEYRPSDLLALCADEVRKVVDDRGIDLVAVSAL
jgi:hypothetical protein